MIYRDGVFQSDPLAVMEDRGGAALRDMPFAGVVQMTRDNRHSITDRAVWTLYNSFTVWHRYLAANGIDMLDLGDETVAQLNALIGDLQGRLSRSVEGHHYSLVGQTGASAIAGAAEELIAAIGGVDRDLRALLNL